MYNSENGRGCDTVNDAVKEKEKKLKKKPPCLVVPVIKTHVSCFRHAQWRYEWYYACHMKGMGEMVFMIFFVKFPAALLCNVTVSVIINNKLPWHTSIAHTVVVLNDVDCRHQQIEQHYLKPTDR